jgi:hypothetical protein
LGGVDEASVTCRTAQLGQRDRPLGKIGCRVRRSPRMRALCGALKVFGDRLVRSLGSLGPDGEVPGVLLLLRHHRRQAPMEVTTPCIVQARVRLGRE